MLVLRQRHWYNPTAGRRADVNGNCLLSFSLAPGAAAWSTWITERTCQSLKLREKLRTEVVFGHKGLFSLHLLHPVQAGQLTQQLLEVLQPRCKGRPLPGSAAHLNGFQGMHAATSSGHACSARAVVVFRTSRYRAARMWIRTFRHTQAWTSAPRERAPSAAAAHLVRAVDGDVSVHPRVRCGQCGDDVISLNT